MVHTTHTNLPREALAAARPVTAFLSYARDNQKHVAALQRELHLRGIRTWRDVTSLRIGALTPLEIRTAIRTESDAFIAYVTPEFLRSRFIWDIEIPEALSRHQRDPRFGIIPLFDGVSPAELKERCAAAGQADLSEFNGGFAQRPGRSRRATLKEIAAATLAAVIELRFSADGDRALNLSFQTGPFRPALPAPDLEVNWCQDFSTPCVGTEMWDRDLFPALDDIRRVIARYVSSRRVVAELYARHCQEFAIGHALSAASGLALTLHRRDGDWSASRGEPLRDLLIPTELAPAGNRSIAVVEVAISREISLYATEALRRDSVQFGRRVVLRPEGGPGPASIGTPEDATEMAQQVATLIRSIHSSGFKQTHLFVAAAPCWTALLGHQLSAVGEIVVYQWDSTSEYRREYSVQ